MFLLFLCTILILFYAYHQSFQLFFSSFYSIYIVSHAGGRRAIQIAQSEIAHHNLINLDQEPQIHCRTSQSALKFCKDVLLSLFFLTPMICFPNDMFFLTSDYHTLIYVYLIFTFMFLYQFTLVVYFAISLYFFTLFYYYSILLLYKML